MDLHQLNLLHLLPLPRLLKVRMRMHSMRLQPHMCTRPRPLLHTASICIVFQRVLPYVMLKLAKLPAASCSPLLVPLPWLLESVAVRNVPCAIELRT